MHTYFTIQNCAVNHSCVLSNEENVLCPSFHWDLYMKTNASLYFVIQNSGEVKTINCHYYCSAWWPYIFINNAHTQQPFHHNNISSPLTSLLLYLSLCMAVRLCLSLLHISLFLSRSLSTFSL